MPTEGPHAVVYAEWLGAPGQPTVLIYGCASALERKFLLLETLHDILDAQAPGSAGQVTPGMPPVQALRCATRFHPPPPSHPLTHIHPPSDLMRIPSSKWLGAESIGGGNIVQLVQQAHMHPARHMAAYSHTSAEPQGQGGGGGGWVPAVDPLELWDTQPFQPVIRDGKFWGRGVDDDKGGLLTALEVWPHPRCHCTCLRPRPGAHNCLCVPSRPASACTRSRFPLNRFASTACLTVDCSGGGNLCAQEGCGSLAVVAGRLTTAPRLGAGHGCVL